MSEWRAERNRRALARLQKALPEMFPAQVLRRALGRPFIPPMPRLAVDGYWRDHPVRADRLARSLAAKTGTPAGWRWRLQSGLACSRYSMVRPQFLPSPRSCLKRGKSCGVEIRQISRTPPSIRVVSG